MSSLMKTREFDAHRALYCLYTLSSLENNHCGGHGFEPLSCCVKVLWVIKRETLNLIDSSALVK